MDFKDVAIKAGLGFVTGGPFGAIAGALSEALPGIAGKVTESSKDSILEKAVDIGRNVIGIKDASVSDIATALVGNPEFAHKYKLALIEQQTEFERIQLEREKLNVENTKDARSMQKEALNQNDGFSKRFIYYFATAWSAFCMTYIAFITFAPIPEANQRFADTILGFLLGTAMAGILTYFFGSSHDTAKTTDAMLKR